MNDDDERRKIWAALGLFASLLEGQATSDVQRQALKAIKADAQAICQGRRSPN